MGKLHRKASASQVTHSDNLSDHKRSNPTLQAALAYVRAGLSVIPISRDGTKRPDGRLLPVVWDDEQGRSVSSWKPFQTALPNEEQVREWFGRKPTPGIAIVCGDASGGLETIDFDAGQSDPYPEWCDLVRERAPGLLERLCVCRTPRQPIPGHHIRYRVSGITVPGNMVLAREPDPDHPGKLRALIETRGSGGYALAPGSPPECHDTGGLYEYVSGPLLTNLATITLEERNILIECARSLTVSIQAGDLASNDIRYASGNKPGVAYNRNADWSDILTRHGWKLVRQSGNVCYWCRPGKSEGWSATTGRCSTEQQGDLLYVFSSNADPFQGEKAYSKFAAYALLEHGGDFGRAAAELGKQGYGDPPARQGNGLAPARPSYDHPFHGRAEGGRPLEGVCLANGQAGSHPAEGISQPAYRGWQWEPIDSRQFFTTDYRPTWLVKRLLVAKQPCVIGAPLKCMKTSMSVDLAVSLASETPFLGYFDVYQTQRVAVLSGESGNHTVQEIARRVCATRGIDPVELPIVWQFTLPKLGHPLDRIALRTGLEHLGVQVVILDPLYLSLTPEDAGNVYQMGALLLSAAQCCLEAGATPILNHHTSKGGGRKFDEPLSLEDLAYAGIGEFARQWLLVNRRTPFTPGSPHELRVLAGGSCGQSGLWAVDIDEGELGEDFSGRIWDVRVTTGGEARKNDRAEKGRKKEEERIEKEREEEMRLLGALDDLVPPGETVTIHRVRNHANPQFSDSKAKQVIARLVRQNVVEEVGTYVPIGSGAMRPVHGIRRVQ